MKERPILFSGPMVTAILEGRKTQTRRVVKYRNRPLDEFAFYEVDGNEVRMNMDDCSCLPCPYGTPGDRLWVRESWFQYEPPHGEVIYKATVPDNIGSAKPWKPSIHMFRSMSRITLEITNVRVERLQDISGADALAEGFDLETCERIFEAAAGNQKTEVAHFVEDSNGNHSDETYCYKCVRVVAAKTKGEVCNFDGGETDGPMYCDMCGVCISVCLLNYGIEREIWLEDDSSADTPHYPVSGRDARIAYEIACQDSTPPQNYLERLSQIGFATLWNKINGKKHPWASNPWVWVVGFQKVG